MAKIDPKYLKGLKFRYSERKEVVEDGRKVTKYEAKERDMETGDVLDCKDTGAEIVIVTADGRKISVAKVKEREK